MIFVDTSFWIAFSLRRDRRTDEARELFEAHASERLVTSNHVRGEAWTLLRRRASHRDGVFFLDRLEHAPRMRVEFVTREQESEALRWLRRHDEREYSFVDATSFALMRSLRIREALAFDGDFTAAGFVELRP